MRQSFCVVITEKRREGSFVLKDGFPVPLMPVHLVEVRRAFITCILIPQPEDYVCACRNVRGSKFLAQNSALQVVDICQL